MRKYREAAKETEGYTKILKCCEKARQDGHQYVWIDTCCIDKRSSAGLSEVINSMWKWYQKSEVCYAYLADVPSEDFLSSIGEKDALSSSRWFMRGWTVQEIIAPIKIEFLGQDWSVIGVKALPHVLAQHTFFARYNNDIFLSKIAEITGISERVLRFGLGIRLVSAAQKMAWASRRQTTRKEDLAYALMGLFNVNMPILYGEGLKKAFRRLQLEIIQMNCFDQSIFVWCADRRNSGLLADSPQDFADSGLECFKAQKARPYSMTNLGLLVNLPVIETRAGECLVYPMCCVRVDGEPKRFGLFLSRVEHRKKTSKASETEIYRRIKCHTFDMTDDLKLEEAERKQLYVLQDEQAELTDRWVRFLKVDQKEALIFNSQCTKSVRDFTFP